MKIGILADTHDNVPRIEQAVDLFNARGVEHVVHAGDFISPFAIEPLKRLRCPVLAVFGNNDGERIGVAARFEGIGEVHPNVGAASLGGREIAVVHYPELAEPLARSGAYDLVVYGHTHRIDERREGSCLLLNPGEAGAWLTGRSTVAIVDLEGLTAEILDLE